MTTKAEGRYRGDGKRPIRGTSKTPGTYHRTSKNASFPQLAVVALVSLRRYKGELLDMEITREISGLVDCCDVILMANEGARHGG